jgi:hypothetical protein
MKMNRVLFLYTSIILVILLSSCGGAPEPVSAPAGITHPPPMTSSPSGAGIQPVFSLWYPGVHGTIILGDLNSLQVYKGHLYAFFSALGEAWRYDGNNWEKAYTVPYLSDWGRYSGWNAIIFKDKLIYPGLAYDYSFPPPYTRQQAVIIFDGTTWKTILLGEDDEMVAVCEYNGKLYAGTTAGRVFSSPDGEHWTLEYTRGGVTNIQAAEVFQNRIYFTAQDDERILIFDGKNYSLVDMGTKTMGIAYLRDALFIGGTDRIIRYDGKRYQTVVNFPISEAIYGPMTFVWLAKISNDALLVSSLREYGVNPSWEAGRGLSELWLTSNGYSYRKIASFPLSIWAAAIYKGNLYVGTIMTALTEKGTTSHGLRELTIYRIPLPINESLPAKYTVPLVERGTLPQGSSTSLEDSTMVDLEGVSALALTVEATFDTAATQGIRVGIKTSTDGFKYDTTDWQTLNVDPSPGERVVRSYPVDASPRFLKVMVENKDTQRVVTKVKITATVTK